MHTVLKKKELGGDDWAVVNKARLVAMLSSNHSWRAFKFLHGDQFDKEAVRGEVRNAFSYGWKEVNESDVKEVVTEQVDERALSMILTCMDEKEERKEYRGMLIQLQADFVDGIEPIETQETI